MSKAEMLRQLVLERPYLAAELSLVTGLLKAEIRALLDNSLLRGHVRATTCDEGLIYHAPGIEADPVRAQVDYHCAALERLGVLVGVEEVEHG